MDNEEKIKEILEENAKLKEELQATKEHLKKYNYFLFLCPNIMLEIFLNMGLSACNSC